MLSNGSQTQPGGAGVEETNGFLKGRMQDSLAAVGGIRDTGHRSELSYVRCTRRESVERAICASRAVSTTVAPASTASTARRWCRKRSRWVSGRVEASKVEMILTRWSGSGSASRDSDAATEALLANSEGRGSGRMGGESGERQIRGVSRVSETDARSTNRWPRAALSAHLFQIAA